MPDGAGIGDLRQLSGAASARQQYAIVVPGASGVRGRRRSPAVGSHPARYMSLLARICAGVLRMTIATGSRPARRLNTRISRNVIPTVRGLTVYRLL